MILIVTEMQMSTIISIFRMAATANPNAENVLFVFTKVLPKTSFRRGSFLTFMKSPLSLIKIHYNNVVNLCLLVYLTMEYGKDTGII